MWPEGVGRSSPRVNSRLRPDWNRSQPRQNSIWGAFWLLDVSSVRIGPGNALGRKQKAPLLGEKRGEAVITADLEKGFDFLDEPFELSQ